MANTEHESGEHKELECILLSVWSISESKYEYVKHMRKEHAHVTNGL